MNKMNGNLKIKEFIINELNKDDEVDVDLLLFKFGNIVWRHLASEGWGSDDEENDKSYIKWLNEKR